MLVALSGGIATEIVYCCGHRINIPPQKCLTLQSSNSFQLADVVMGLAQQDETNAFGCIQCIAQIFYRNTMRII
ncbi:hypothetical protein AO935_31755 [Pseudomonas aeruginosa]|nr:hypothetical protein AO935_31755 [Pseudomonas aeruginosa]